MPASSRATSRERCTSRSSRSSTAAGSTQSPTQTASAALAVEAPGEHGHALERAPLGLRQQPVGPVDRGAQRPVALALARARAREQREALVEVTRDLRGRERAAARRGELDGERQAVEPAADARHRLGVGGVELEVPARRAGAVDEQRNRIGSLQSLELLALGQAERPQPQHLLAVDPERLAAGCHEARTGTSGEDPLGELGRAREHVLAVVEHQDPRALAQRLDDRVGLAVAAEGVGDRGGHGVVRVERGEDAPAHVVAVLRRGPRGRLDRQPRLACATEADDRDERFAAHQLAQVRKLALTTEEAGPCRRGRGLLGRHSEIVGRAGPP